ncbi:hypothetical protein D3C83_202380 [compost metagenome]
MQDRGVDLAHDLVRLVAIHAPRALVPQQDPAVEILADDRVLGRGLEHVADEFDRLFGGADDGAVKQLGGHEILPC